MCALATQTPKRKQSNTKTMVQGEPTVDRVMFNEREFLQLLVLERKRSERSGRPFLLMLLNGNGIFVPDGSERLRERFSTALLAAIRETDFIGWYEDGSVIGVVFTELAEPISEAVDTVATRISDTIRSQVELEETDKIDISFHLFPKSPANDNNTPNDMTLYPDLKGRSKGKKAARVMKRVLDIAGSLSALVVLSPVFGAIALAIKATSKGPILFSQVRVGQYSQPFRFLKFRSMYINSDSAIHREYVAKFISGKAETHESENGDGVFKITNDPRVTPVGRFLRKTSLDELPQLFNVLIGEMSLVGPRPPLPYEVEQYDFWHRRRILEARPGITGLWQVNGRSRTSFDEMVRMDLRYIEQSSLMLDLKILLQTPLAVFSGDGAY